jgi:hypothetical protein
MGRVDGKNSLSRTYTKIFVTGRNGMLRKDSFLGTYYYFKKKNKMSFLSFPQGREILKSETGKRWPSMHIFHRAM